MLLGALKQAQLLCDWYVIDRFGYTHGSPGRGGASYLYLLHMGKTLQVQGLYIETSRMFYNKQNLYCQYVIKLDTNIKQH